MVYDDEDPTVVSQCGRKQEGTTLLEPPGEVVEEWMPREEPPGRLLSAARETRGRVATLLAVGIACVAFKRPPSFFLRPVLGVRPAVHTAGGSFFLRAVRP